MTVEEFEETFDCDNGSEHAVRRGWLGIRVGYGK
jgi:hypothetical protein